MKITKKILKNDLKNLTKPNLVEILDDNTKVYKYKKAKLVSMVFEKIYGNELLIAKIYKKYAKKMAIHPSHLEKLLDITKTERKKMQNSFLPILFYEDVNMYGKTFEMPMFDRYEVYKISKKDIRDWRKKEEKIQDKNRKRGAKKAIRTRNKNVSKHEKFYKTEWPKLLKKWHKKNFKIGATLELAFWTTWASRWAKYYQLKEKRARTKGEEYRAKKELFYKIKNNCIKLLVKSPIATLEFYRPQVSSKISNARLCEYHFNEFKTQFPEYFNGTLFHGFMLRNQDELNRCKKCKMTLEKDYYSLYFLKIVTPETTDYSFSFHTPYPIGRKFLPSKKELPSVTDHRENEGMFRFGRLIDDDEKIIFKEKDVLKQIEDASRKFQMYFE